MRYEYRTLTVPYPVSDKYMEKEKKYEEEDREYARQKGVEYKPAFISQSEFVEKLNIEGLDGWQVAGIFPSGATTMSVVMMRNRNEL